MKQTTVDDCCKSSFSEELIYFKFALGNKSAQFKEADRTKMEQLL